MSLVSLCATNLSVRYSELPALEIKELSLKGSVIALLGHNGAGKSTLIKTMLGLLEPATGKISITNERGELLRADQHMAFCPENGAVFADIKVERYLELWCRIKHNNGSYYRKEGSRYVERLGLPELLVKKGRELSKGQRRRVQTALGFMSDPEIFLFDEPFDGLDVQRTNDLMEIVEEEKTQRAFLISSHRMDVIERISDMVIVLQHGRIACAGSVLHVCQTFDDKDISGSQISLTDAMRAHLRKIRLEEGLKESVRS